MKRKGWHIKDTEWVFYQAGDDGTINGWFNILYVRAHVVCCALLACLDCEESNMP